MVSSANQSPSSFSSLGEMLKTSGLKPNTYTGSTVASLEDVGPLVRMNAAGANTYTILADGGSPFPDYSFITVMQRGAGATTIVPGDGVLLNGGSGSKQIAAQYGWVTLFKEGPNSWLITGSLA